MNHARLILLSLFISSGQAFAILDRYFIPTQLPAEIQLLNKSADSMDFWLGHPIWKNPNTGDWEYEMAMSVLPKSKRPVILSSYPQFAWVQIKLHDEFSEKLIVKLRKVSGETVDLPRERASIFKSNVPRGYHNFLVTNLSEIRQKVRILSFHGVGTLKSIPDEETQIDLEPNSSVTLQQSELTRSVRIEGELPIFAAWVMKDDFQLMTPIQAPLFAKPNVGVNFIFANSSRKESFVATLTDEKMIEEARAQILRPGSSPNTILVADPGIGSNDVNQNLSTPYWAPWSWHVEKVYRFSFIGSEDCGGTASVLEDLLNPWIASGRTICFRDFRVIGELKNK